MAKKKFKIKKIRLDWRLILVIFASLIMIGSIIWFLILVKPVFGDNILEMNWINLIAPSSTFAVGLVLSKLLVQL